MGYRVVNKVRFYIFITFLSIFGVVLIMSVFSMNLAHSSNYQYKYKEVKIVEGDTLWVLALEYAPKEYDVRRMIYDIRRFNDMDTSQIYVGDTLRIPIIK